MHRLELAYTELHLLSHCQLTQFGEIPLEHFTITSVFTNLFNLLNNSDCWNTVFNAVFVCLRKSFANWTQNRHHSAILCMYGASRD